MITELKIENFKSFGTDMRPLSLRPLNFIVGANASGKTNLVSALRFLKIAILQGADLAVAEFEGVSEVRNKIQRERRQPKPLRISLKVDAEKSGAVRVGGVTVHPKSYAYCLELDLRAEDGVPVVQKEELQAVLATKDGTTATYRMHRDQTRVTIEDPVFPSAPKDPIPIQKQDATRLIAGTGFFSPPVVLFRHFIEGWAFFNVNPESARRPCKETSDLTLGESAEYLAVILHRLEKGEKNGARSAIVAGLKGAVPGFRDVQAKPLEVEGKWTFKILEERMRGGINPRSVSDGTIRLLALMVIAHWSAQHSTLLVIEEPETGLHPHLTPHIAQLLRAASESRQVLVTTHNPDFLDELQPEEVILCDKEGGFTQVRQASDVAEIGSLRKTFRLGELWVQGTLGGIP